MGIFLLVNKMEYGVRYNWLCGCPCRKVVCVIGMSGFLVVWLSFLLCYWGFLKHYCCLEQEGKADY